MMLANGICGILTGTTILAVVAATQTLRVKLN